MKLSEVVINWWSDARVLLDPKTEELLRDEIKHLINALKTKQKHQIETILREIEKEKKFALKMIEKKHRTDYFSGVRNAFIITENLIKKAFESVIE